MAETTVRLPSTSLGPGKPDTTVAATVKLGSVSRIPEGQGRCYVVGAQEIAVFR